MRGNGGLGACAVVSLCVLCTCGNATPQVTACEERVAVRREGLLGQCQDAANAKRRDAANLCLAAYLMTRDAATGARAARALQGRDGELPIIEWIANSVGDSAEGADSWLAVGLTRHRLGQFPEALAALKRGAEHRATDDKLGLLHDAVARVYYHENRTEYPEAIEQAAIAYELASGVCRPYDRAVAYLNIGGLLVDFGTASMTRQLVELAKPLVPVDSANYPWLRRLEAQVHEAQGHPAEAQRALYDAWAYAIREGNRGLEFNLRMNLIYNALRHGALNDAAALLAYELLPPDAEPNDRAAEVYRRAWLALDRGDAGTAAALIERMLPTAPGAWIENLEYIHGRALRQRGELVRAEKVLLRAAELVELARKKLSLDTFKSWLLADQRGPFEELFLLYISQGRLLDALATAQRATARSTLDGLLASELPAAATATTGEHVEGMRKLARALRKSHPSVTPPITTVLAQLRGNHVVTFFRARRELWAIALAANGSLTAHNIGDVATLVDRGADWRQHPENTAIADQLGAMLLPDDVMPPRDEPLYIVADEPIMDMSFAALRRNGAFVVDHNPVAYAPSAAVLVSMRRSNAEIHALVLGDPTYDLPQARAEATEVAARLHVAPRLGVEATSFAMLGNSGATLIHVAAHTKPTPVGSALRMSDGLLDAAAVLDHGVTVGAIVLLTCSSAAVTSQDELAPLAAAFVAGGAHTVVASRWAVEDQVGHDFAHLFYQAKGVIDPVRAVAIAQRRLAAQGVPIAQWSTFAVVGGLP